MKRLLLLLLTPAWLVATQARAGQFTIQFDFTGSSVSMLGGIAQIPPDGSIASASGQLDVSAAGLATPIPGGNAALRNFAMAATVNAATFGNAIQGNVALNQVGGGVPGVLTPGLSSVVFGAPMQIAQSGALGCSGPSCAILGLPAVLGGTQLVALAAMPIANLAQAGNALISGTYAITVAGITGQLHLVGTEVSRVYVPEPASASLLVAGLCGIAGWRVRRLLRRR